MTSCCHLLETYLIAFLCIGSEWMHPRNRILYDIVLRTTCIVYAFSLALVTHGSHLTTFINIKQWHCRESESVGYMWAASYALLHIYTWLHNFDPYPERLAMNGYVHLVADPFGNCPQWGHHNSDSYIKSQAATMRLATFEKRCSEIEEMRLLGYEDIIMLLVFRGHLFENKCLQPHSKCKRPKDRLKL